MTYIGEDGKEHRPYMVHRALLGSLERFFGVLVEHYAGAFPVWLAYKGADDNKTFARSKNNGISFITIVSGFLVFGIIIYTFFVTQ